MFIIIVFDRVLKRSSSVSSQDFYCSLPRDQLRDVTDELLAWEFLLIKSVLHFAFLHFLPGYYYYDYVVIGVLRPSWLLLLRLCCNRCAEALVVKIKFSIGSPLYQLMRLNS